jgi:hypothetical protein
MSRHLGGHTCARSDTTRRSGRSSEPGEAGTLPGPIHRMGRAVHCQAHPLTGKASTQGPRRNTEDDRNRSTFAHMFIPRPEQADEVHSAR